jgi:hypothetical protein
MGFLRIVWLSAILIAAEAMATAQTYDPTNRLDAPVVVARARSVRLVATIPDEWDGEVYEGEFSIIRHVGGRPVPRRIRIRFVSHSAPPPRLELLAILEQLRDGTHLARYFAGRRPNESYCLPHAIVRQYSLSATFVVPREDELCERRR